MRDFERNRVFPMETSLHPLNRGRDCGTYHREESRAAALARACSGFEREFSAAIVSPRGSRVISPVAPRISGRGGGAGVYLT